MTAKILVVEDDEKVRDSMTRLLKLKGYEVTEARHGQQAVELATEQLFDLVLMDVKMPTLDGVSAFQQIRAAYPTTKVILTTGFAINEELKRVLTEGHVQCLQKPFTYDQLTAAMEDLLSSPG